MLSGSYVEAGDTGRHRVEPGDVILHRAYERHLDRFSMRGAEVLVIPLADAIVDTVLGRVHDPDTITMIAERDMPSARAALIESLAPKQPAAEDWPDQLASDLIADPDLSLSSWASGHGLHPGSLARGFGQQFAVSPDSFRTVARTRRAIDDILSTQIPLSAIAVDHGFADQAHMSRAVKRLTGHSPNALRRI